MNNIFQQMNIPRLGDPNFQTDFNDFCQSIIQNISSLMSIQYTRGEPGNSVLTETVHVGYEHKQIIDPGTSITFDGYCLTNISAGFLNAIFSPISPAFDTNPLNPDDASTTQEVDILIGGTRRQNPFNDDFNENGIAPNLIVGNRTYKAISEFMDPTDPTDPDSPGAGVDVEVVVDRENGRAFLVNPYIFMDERIKGLDRLVRNREYNDEIYRKFEDFTVAVYGSATFDETDTSQSLDDISTWTWSFDAIQIVPKLYYDGEIHEFCWKVNGQETGITAQGIKGNDGKSINTYIAVGHAVSSDDENDTSISDYVEITHIQCIDEQENIHWAIRNPLTGEWYYTMNGMNVVVESPATNDLVIVFWGITGDTDDTDDQTVLNFNYSYIGKIDIVGGTPKVYIGNYNNVRTDVFESIRDHNMWLNMLRINSNTEMSPRGYALPAAYNNPNELGYSTSAPYGVQGVHITYTEKDPDLQTARLSTQWGRKHSAPVLSNQGQVGPGNAFNPITDHIGDWQIDYNTSIQGNNTIMGDNTIVHNEYIQGNLNTQGFNTTRGKVFNPDINGTIIGYGTTFQEIAPLGMAAALCKFTDTRAKFHVDNVSGAFYNSNVKLHTNLKIQIGIYKGKSDSDNMVRSLGTRINDYSKAGYWSGSSSGSDQISNYDKELGRLYDVVEYNIPIDIDRSYSTPPEQGAWSWTNGNGFSDIASLFTQGMPSQNTEIWKVYCITNERHPIMSGPVDLSLPSLFEENMDNGNTLSSTAYEYTLKYKNITILLRLWFYFCRNSVYDSNHSDSFNKFIIVPFGYLKMNNGSDEYYSPIYASVVGINNTLMDSQDVWQKIEHPASQYILNEPNRNKYGGNKIISHKEGYFNPLISNFYKDSSSSNYESDNEVIVEDSDTMSYFGLFSQYTNDYSQVNLATQTVFPDFNMEPTYYNKMMPGIMVIDGNPGVYANNSDDGTWICQGASSGYWVSHNPVCPVVFQTQSGGYFANINIPRDPTLEVPAALQTPTLRTWPVGATIWRNNTGDNSPYGYKMNGLLVYPYVPTMIPSLKPDSQLHGYEFYSPGFPPSPLVNESYGRYFKNGQPLGSDRMLGIVVQGSNYMNDMRIYPEELFIGSSSSSTPAESDTPIIFNPGDMTEQTES